MSTEVVVVAKPKKVINAKVSAVDRLSRSINQVCAAPLGCCLTPPPPFL
jgi:hypothetical protein